jgi:hypothetical protein
LKVPCMYIDWHIVWGLCRRQCREMIQHLSGRTAYKNWLKRRGAWAFLALLSSMFFMWLCASQCWITCFLSLTPLHHAISRRHVANHVSLHCALSDRLSRSAQCSPQHADKRHMLLPAAPRVQLRGLKIEMWKLDTPKGCILYLQMSVNLSGNLGR